MAEQQLKDQFREQRLFVNRCVAAVVVLAILIGILITRLTFLQIISHHSYSQQSRENRIKLIPVAPTRGLIYDRNGVLLAGNLPSFTLTITPELAEDVEDTIAQLKNYVEITEDDLKRFKKQKRRNRKFTAIPIRFRLSEEEVAKIATNRHRFPSVDVSAGLIRHYPHGILSSHFVGYVGRINEKELDIVDPTNYKATSHIGKTGIEKSYEAELHGKVGVQQIETNAIGRQLRIIDEVAPIKGTDLYLSVDIQLQKKAYDALGDNNGSVIAIDPANGDVLAFVSKPAFDANLFVNGISQKHYSALQRNKNKPLFNRAVHGQYPPGSTVKPFMGLAGLDHGVATETSSVYCPGFFKLPNSPHKYRDWKRWGHGHTDLSAAIVQSCDVYFYDLAVRLGIDKIHSYMDKFGFGQKTNIDLPAEEDGLLPSREWKKKRRNEIWYPGETVIVGIGQGFLQTTPLQLAHATATLAARGDRVQPKLHYASKQPHDDGLEIIPAIRLPQIDVEHPYHWTAVIQPMIDVIHSAKGTAKKISEGVAYIAAGKTGTAQVYGLKQDEEYDEDNIPKELRDHALFVAFAPAHGKAKIAVAVVVENGGSGGSIAAPVSRDVIDAYFEIINYAR